MYKEFNINYYVKVKLTQVGKDELLRQHKEWLIKIPSLKREFTLPKEDEDGYSKWQMHSLMNSFGHLMSIGFNTPFETEILIDIK